MFSKDGRQADATYFSNRWSSSQHSTFSFFSKWGFVFQGPVTYFQLTHTQELTTSLKFLPESKQTVEVTLVLPWEKSWCEKLLQSSSFIYRRGELKTEQNKGWNYTLQFTHTHIFFKDILQLQCLSYYVSSFAFRFTFLSKHRWWWLLKYLKAI